MKYYNVATLLILLSFCSCAQAANRTWIVKHTEGSGEARVTRAYFATEAELAQCPLWDGNGEPQFTMAQAIDVARRRLSVNSGSSTNHVLGISLHPISPIGDDYHGKYRWYYQVTLSTTDGAYGTVIMLMNGHIIEPEIE